MIKFTVPEDNTVHSGTIVKTYSPGKHVVLDHTAQAKGEAQPSRFVFAPQIVEINDGKNLR